LLTAAFFFAVCVLTKFWFFAARAQADTESATPSFSPLVVVLEHLRSQSIGTATRKGGGTDTADIEALQKQVSKMEMEVFTAEHDAFLLTEAGPETQANGQTVDFRPCVRGKRCKGLEPFIEGADLHGGRILRETLTPNQLDVLLRTGEYPSERQMCLLCARYETCKAFLWLKSQTDVSRSLRNVIVNWFSNPVDCEGGYKSEYTIPGPFATQSWSYVYGGIATVQYNLLRWYRHARTGKLAIDQSAMLWRPPAGPKRGRDGGQLVQSASSGKKKHFL